MGHTDPLHRPIPFPQHDSVPWGLHELYWAWLFETPSYFFNHFLNMTGFSLLSKQKRKNFDCSYSLANTLMCYLVINDAERVI